MAAPPFYPPLAPLLLAFCLCTAAAAAQPQQLHLEHHGHGPHHHHHHHRSPSVMTATARLDTAPSMHQGRMESEAEETRPLLRVLDPFFTTRLDIPSPPPPLPAGDPMRGGEPFRDAASAPPPPHVVDEPYRDAGISPPTPVVGEAYHDLASPPPARAVTTGTGHDLGRYVVHGLHGFIPPLSHASCVEDAHAHHHHQVHLCHYRRHHHLSARSAATSAATAASVVSLMIREAISRLRDSGFGFVALAMRVEFPELEKLSNLTVFALDDQVIFTGGGHGYVSAVRFHIVPGHRLTRADLLLLRPGAVLPTLAGEDQKLVITLGAATDEVRVNYIPVKHPDVVINSRVAVHGIHLPFPSLHLAVHSYHPLPRLHLAATGCNPDYHSAAITSYCLPATSPSDECCGAVLATLAAGGARCLCLASHVVSALSAGFTQSDFQSLYETCGGTGDYNTDLATCSKPSQVPSLPPSALSTPPPPTALHVEVVEPWWRFLLDWFCSLISFVVIVVLLFCMVKHCKGKARKIAEKALEKIFCIPATPSDRETTNMAAAGIQREVQEAPLAEPDNVTAAQKYLGMTGLEVKKISKPSEESDGSESRDDCKRTNSHS